MLRRFNYKITFLGSNATEVAKQTSEMLLDSSWIEKTSSFKLKTFDKAATKVIVEEVTGKSVWCCKVALTPWSKPWILNKTKLALPILGLAFSVLMGISSYKLLVANTSIENHSSKVILSTEHSTPSWSFVVFKAFSLSVISISTMAMVYGFWVNKWEDNNEIEYLCSGHTNFCKSGSGGNFVNANLVGVNFIQADLRNANLRSANLLNATLIDADLTGANLSNATLVGADLTGVVLKNACLRNSDLRNANLTGVDLAGVDIEGAILDEA